MAEEAIGDLGSKVNSVLEKIWPGNPNLEVHDGAGCVRAKRVVIRRAVVPLNVVQNLTQLPLEDIDVATLGPVVPEVTELEVRAAQVHVKKRVKLLRPRRGGWGG